MHDIPESESEDPKTRKKEDNDFVQSVFSEVLNIPATITNTFRLGNDHTVPDFSKSLFNPLTKKLSSVIKLSSGRKIMYITSSLPFDLIPSEQKNSKALRINE